jgi:hypothetical protein
MTTSVTDTVHLHLGAALAANPVGVLAVATAVLLLVRRDIVALRLARWPLPAGLAGMWVFELLRVFVF